MASVRSKLKRIKFTDSPTRAGRIHYLTPDDFACCWAACRRSFGSGCWRSTLMIGVGGLGTDNMPDMSIVRVARLRSAHFQLRSVVLRTLRGSGDVRRTRLARCGKQWPRLAVRRFFLYDVFLHELGHLQIVDPDAKTPRRRFASETLAWRFANQWRRKLWLEHFDHPDPVHNPPSSEKLMARS